MPTLTRRRFAATLLAGTAAAGYAASLRGRAPLLLVLGGGTAGAAAALALAQARPDASVVLVERDPTQLAGRAQAAFTTPGAGVALHQLRAAGVEVVLDEVTEIDWRAARLALFSGRSLAFDGLMLAPGTAPVLEDIPGLDPAARHRWPSAWGSDREAARLSAALGALPDRGHVVLRLPAEISHAEAALARALELATWIDRHRPAARLSVLDASDAGLDAIYRESAAARGLRVPVDWRSATTGGNVLGIDAPAGRLETSGGRIEADVVNFVTPMSAGHIARTGGLADASGWCPCDAAGRSSLREGAVILGDARKEAVRTVAHALNSVASALQRV